MFVKILENLAKTIQSQHCWLTRFVMD